MATMSAPFLAELGNKIGKELAKEFDTLMGTPGTMSNQLFRAMERHMGFDGAKDLQTNITSRSTLKTDTLLTFGSFMGHEHMVTLNSQG